jgi:hypothetical protein
LPFRQLPITSEPMVRRSTRTHVSVDYVSLAGNHTNSTSKRRVDADNSSRANALSDDDERDGKTKPKNKHQKKKKNRNNFK